MSLPYAVHPAGFGILLSTEAPGKFPVSDRACPRPCVIVTPPRRRWPHPAIFILLPTFAAPDRLHALPEHPGVVESLVYQLNGLVVVFIALGLIWVTMEAMGAVFRRTAARQNARTAALAVAPASPAVAPTAPLPDRNSPDAATLVAIFAAVHSVLDDDDVRIVAITPLADARDWSREGRRDHFSSHRVR